MPYLLYSGAPRVKESTSTTGTGTWNLGGAATGGHQTWVAAYGTGALVHYFAENTANSEWEEGVGTVTDAATDTLSRDVILRSSNSNSVVNFTAAPNVFDGYSPGYGQPNRRNYLINGGGDLAQRGTQLGASFTGTVSTISASMTTVSSLTGLREGMSFTSDRHTGIVTISAITASNAATISANGASNGSATCLSGLVDGQYCADRWYVLSQTNPIRYDRSTGDGDRYAIKLTQSHGTAQRFGLAQVIEQANCLPLRSKVVRAQCRVKISTGSQTIRCAIVEWTSTADSPTKDVVNDWTSGTFTAGNFFLGSNLTITATGSVAPSSGTWTTLTCTGTVSSSANNIYLVIWTDGTQAQNVTLEVTEAQLLEGYMPSNWVPVPIAVTTLESQRYFGKTFDIDTAPVFGANVFAGALLASSSGTGSGTALGVSWKLPASMRVAPTVKTFSTTNYNSSWYDGTGGGSVAASSVAGTSSVYLTNNATVTDARLHYIHATADAEL